MSKKRPFTANDARWMNAWRRARNRQESYVRANGHDAQSRRVAAYLAARMEAVLRRELAWN